MKKKNPSIGFIETLHMTAILSAGLQIPYENMEVEFDVYDTRP